LGESLVAHPCDDRAQLGIQSIDGSQCAVHQFACADLFARHQLGQCHAVETLVLLVRQHGGAMTQDAPDFNALSW
jgi:hypothetical protein